MATAAKPVQYNTMPGSAHAPTACPHCTQPHRSAPSSISEVGVWAALPLVQCQSANAYRFHVCKWKFLTIALYLLFRVSSLDPPSHFVSCVSSSVFLCAHLISWCPHAPTCQTLGLGKLGPFFPAAFGSALSTLLTKGARSRLEIWGLPAPQSPANFWVHLLLYLIVICFEEDDKAASMATARPILYNAWISSCSHRVRIALNLKGKLLLPLHTLESGWFLGLAEHLIQ